MDTREPNVFDYEKMVPKKTVTPGHVVRFKFGDQPEFSLHEKK
jgi:hypothetical protein